MCFNSVQAQRLNELDSLVRDLKVLPDDTVKVFIYGRVSRIFSLMRDKNELARKYADSMLWLSEKLHFERGVVGSYYRRSDIENFAGNYQKAIDYAEKCLQFYIHEKDSFKIVNALFALGKSYKSMGKLDESLSNFLQAVRICDKIKDYDGAANAWNSISSIYRQMGNYQEAIQHYNQAINIYQSLNKTKEYAMALQNLANVYSEINSYDTAKLLYNRALEFIQRLGLQYEEAIILGSRGEMYNKLGQYQDALKSHLTSLSIRRKLENRRSLTFGLLNVGDTYFKLNKYFEADKYLKEGMQLAQEIQAKDLMSSIYEVLSNVAVARGDYKNAFRFNNLYNQWKDSIFNEVTTKQMQELEAKYESEKKDQQIVILSKEKELQEKEAQRQSTLKQLFIFGLSLAVIFTVLIFYVYRQKLRNQRLIAVKDNEIKEAIFKSQMSELEMKALRAQINPHFLFNCMNSINRMILEGENENASLYLAKFSKLVRLILENAESPQVSLQNELTLLESYIQLEALRFKGKINYKITVSKDIDPHAMYLPAMILQPFVENAIWHGLMHKQEGEQGMVEIAVQENAGRLFCIIEDNGVGRERAGKLAEKSIIKSKSLGVKITEERLQLLSKSNWGKVVHIIDLKDSFNRAMGTRVEIIIPVT